jgi:hypothetical protein
MSGFSWDSAIIVEWATEQLRLPFSILLHRNFVDGFFVYPFPLNFQLLAEYSSPSLVTTLLPLSFSNGKRDGLCSHLSRVRVAWPPRRSRR